MYANNSLSTKILPCVVAGVLSYAFAASLKAATLDGPSELVDCGTSATGSDTYTTRGTKCTSSSNPASKHGDAVADANANFQNWLNTGFHCGECPVEQTGCTKTTGFGPAYTEADCTFSYQGGCQGNPLKTLVIANCTKHINWIVSCDYCS